MKRALLLAPYFLPRRRVGSMRPFRFAIHLREFGWAPTVLTIKAEGQHLTDKEARLLADVEVVELEPPFDRTVGAESQLGIAGDGKEARPAWRTVVDGMDLPNLNLPALGLPSLDDLDRQVPVDTWLLLFLLRYRRIAETVRRTRPHVLWSTGDPWSSLVLGMHLRRRFGVPWVADFRDPWTLCEVRSEGLWAPTKAVNRFFERRILETADTVLFQAAQIEARYRRHYADLDLRTTTIHNSYDPVVFDDPVALQDPPAPHPAGDALDVGFFGRFRAMSPAAPMTDVLAALRARHPDLAGAVRVHSIGPLAEEDAQYAAVRGVRDAYRRREAVPLERALATLRRFDLLLLSTDPRRDGIIPAKLLEYLAAGRPVLSLSRNPEVARILEETGTGRQYPLDDPERVADVLAACVRARRTGDRLPIPFAPRPEAVRRFEARPTTRALAAWFEETMRARARRPGQSVAPARSSV